MARAAESVVGTAAADVDCMEVVCMVFEAAAPRTRNGIGIGCAGIAWPINIGGPTATGGNVSTPPGSNPEEVTVMLTIPESTMPGSTILGSITPWPIWAGPMQLTSTPPVSTVPRAPPLASIAPGLSRW